ncbi:MAG: hypothetical protein U0229_25155 [Anaeromyxobacter sp.]
MSTPRPWTVLPHGPVEPLDENQWHVTSVLPRGPMDRRMTIVRRADGLLFHNAVPLDEPAMEAVLAHGAPAWLFVPNGFHRLDVHAWKARFPSCKVVAPAGSAAGVAKKVPVDLTADALPPDPALEVQVLDGTRGREAVLIARGPRGASLVFGDAVMNVQPVPGPAGFMLRLLGTSGEGPKVTTIAKLFLVDDRRALAAHLARLSALPDLARLVPSHGPVVEDRGGKVLAAAAARLLG